MSGKIEILDYGVIAATADELGVFIDVRVPLCIELSYEDIRHKDAGDRRAVRRAASAD